MLTVYSWNGQVKFMNLETVTRENTIKELSEQEISETTQITFSKGIKIVESGVIELFPSVKKIICYHSLENIEETPELLSLLTKNDVLIRGYYDSYSEDFAKRNHLRFVHADILLGEHDDEEHSEGSSWTICFEDDGTPYLMYESWGYGRDSGNVGGSIRHEVDNNFYVGWTAEKYADNFGEHFSDQIRNNKDLDRFFKAANERLNKNHQSKTN